MVDITSLQQLTSLVNAVALGLALAGVCWVGILAGIGRLHWFWRLCLVSGPLLLLLPIRAYEPVVLLGPLMAALAVTAAFLRPQWEQNLKRQSGHSSERQPVTAGKKNRYAISLGDALLWMTITGIALAVAVQLPWSNLNVAPLGFCFDFGLFFLLSVACLGVVGLPRGTIWAIALFGGILLGIVFMSSWGDGLRALYLIGVTGPQHLEWLPLTLFILTLVTLLTVGLWLTRWCCLAAPGSLQVAQRQRLVGSLAAVIAAPGAVLYAGMFSGPSEVSGPRIPDNSLPKLIQIATQLDDLGIGEATLRELRSDNPAGNLIPQVEAIYEESLRRVKEPGCVSLDVSRRANEDSLSMQESHLTMLRALARRWSREAEHAFRSGDVRLATEFDLAILRLGNQLSRGGIRIHVQAATSIKSIGLSHLSLLREHVPIDLIPSVVNVLEMLDLGEENPQITNARDRYWTDVAHGWRHRLETVVNRAVGLPSTETATYQSLKQPLAREAAQRRLLSTDFALRHYFHIHGKYPATLAALVPARMALLPIDPFTQQLLIYRPLQYSFVLYSTGPDARDDGGHFGRFLGDQVQLTGQDWRLESLMRIGRRREPSLGRFYQGTGPRTGAPAGPAGWLALPWERETRGQLADDDSTPAAENQSSEKSQSVVPVDNSSVAARSQPPATGNSVREPSRTSVDYRWRKRRIGVQ